MSFRSTLKRELAAWTAEGIIDAAGAKKLDERYKLSELEKESSGLLSAVIYVIGGVMLGGGLITFVAANWDGIPAALKVALLIGGLVALLVSGYWLWFRKGWERLGHALIFTGCLSIGAVINLLALTFNIEGEWYGALPPWAIASAVVAYAVRSWLIGTLGLVLAVTWYVAYVPDHPSRTVAAVIFLIAGVFGYLAYWVRCRILYAATIFGVAFCMGVLALAKQAPGRFPLMALLSAGFLAWVLGEYHRVRKVREEFGVPAAGLGLLILGLTTFLFSFYSWWEYHAWSANDRGTLHWVVPAVIALGASAVLSAGLIGKTTRMVLFAGVALAVALLGVNALRPVTPESNWLWPTVMANIAALLIGAVAIGIGVIDERRIAFWAGTLYTLLLIVIRFLEYKTSLLAKSAAFILCGIATIGAGILYERYLRRRDDD